MIRECRIFISMFYKFINRVHWNYLDHITGDPTRVLIINFQRLDARYKSIYKNPLRSYILTIKFQTKTFKK